MLRLNTLILTLVTASAALAQQPGTRYTIGIRHKVDPAKRAEYIEFVKGASSKVMKEWLKTNPKLLSWTVLEVSYGGSPMLDYNFTTSFTYDGPPPEEFRPSFEAALKNAGMTWEGYQAKVNSLRTVVGQHLRRSVASARGPASADYVVASYFKAAPGRMEECRESLRSVSQPVYTSIVNDGSIAGWEAGEIVFPRGQSQTIDFFAATYHKTLAEATDRANPYAAHFAKVHPAKNYIGYIDFYRASRTLVRTDLLHTVARVSRQ